MHLQYFILYAAIVGCSLVLGLVMKFLLDWIESEFEITWTEIVVVMLVVMFVVAPIGSWAGWNAAKADLLSFNQFINTWAVGYQIVETNCVGMNGPCKNTYDCNRHVCGTYSCEPCTCTGGYDSAGNCKSKTCSTCLKYCVDQCPYCTKEWTAVIYTAIDWLLDNQPAVFARHVLPKNPNDFRWDPTVAVPADLPFDAPQIWYDLRKEIQTSRYAVPIVRRDTYTGYTLAADIGKRHEYQADIQKLIEIELMPKLKTGLESDGISANRVYFVGFDPPDKQEWWDAHAELDAALGMLNQGDIHVVIMNVAGHDLSPSRVPYAIKYDWQDKEKYHDNVLGKNTVLVVVATNDDQTVLWISATTGMPEDDDVPVDYNADMRVALRQVVPQPGIVPLTPQAVLGVTRTEYADEMVNPDPMYGMREIGETVHVIGLINQVVFGLNQTEEEFQRISMSAGDPGDYGEGFLQLEKMIIPTRAQRVWIVIITTALTMFVWGGAVIIGARYDFPWRGRGW